VGELEAAGREPAETETRDVWTRLRAFTPARIGLGRVGGSTPTRALLEFELAHARARDAVHAPFDTGAVVHQLQESGFGPISVVASQAGTRTQYLLRPDLGRALDAESRAALEALPSRGAEPRLAFVIADGLSALAVERHALPLLRAVRAGYQMLLGDFWKSVTVVVAKQARVALADEIGQILAAEAVVVLIGERPGLSSPDSLGVYLTWAPRLGRTDAERNCISNVRPEGLPYPEAAKRLVYLLCEARRLQLSGVGLKDDSDIRAHGAGKGTQTLPETGVQRS
jgi:ethanolamine ammonia-lyase small subunit